MFGKTQKEKEAIWKQIMNFGSGILLLLTALFSYDYLTNNEAVQKLVIPTDIDFWTFILVVGFFLVLFLIIQLKIRDWIQD